MTRGEVTTLSVLHPCNYGAKGIQSGRFARAAGTERACVRFMLRAEPVPPDGWFPVFWSADEEEPAVVEMRRLRTGLDAIAKTHCSHCSSGSLAKGILYDGRKWPDEWLTGGATDD